MNRKDLTYKVKESIRSIDPDARVILFGSRARGDNKGSSDWDFLVLTSHQVDEYTKRQIRDRLLDTELEAEEVISSIIFSQDKWSDYQITPLYKNISKDGIEL
ncbi:MAG TPA: nucleotidyltransferase domain-containing protein [Bacteroidales bacterium]|nr:nucleotidyltransferase domain-containing protein [Bacteroidales bacterium]